MQKNKIFTFNGLKMNLEQAVLAFKITNNVKVNSKNDKRNNEKVNKKFNSLLIIRKSSAELDWILPVLNEMKDKVNFY